MKYISSTESSNYAYNADFDWMFVDVDLPMALVILNRHRRFMEMKKYDSEIWEMYFWGGDVEWFSASESLQAGSQGECVALDDQTWTPFSKGWWWGSCGVEPLPQECTQMIICEQGVRWTTIPRHASLYITSATIPIAEIGRIE